MTQKILIVDDSRTILRISSKIVSSILPAMEVVTFDSPKKALEEITNSSDVFEFAFLDYNMEEMNGIELVQALLSLSPQRVSSQNISIVSANVQEAVIEKAKNLGISFLPKPFDEQKLRSFLEQRGFSSGK